MYDYGNLGSVKWPESDGLIIEFSGRLDQGPVVVGCGFFKIFFFSSNTIPS